MSIASQLPSSAPVPPTFQEDGDSANFLAWMQGRVGALTDSPSLMKKENRTEWAHTVSGLISVLLLPGPDELRWEAMHEQVKFTEISLQIIYHAATNVPSLFAGENLLPQALFVVIAIICTTLDRWIDADPPPQEGYLSPKELYALASSAASAILQGLADELIPSAAPTSRQILKGIIDQCGWIINSEYCCFG